MATGLPTQRLITVNVNLSPTAAQFANFNSVLILGDSTVIDTFQRIRSYSGLTEVALDFSASAPEYKAAAIFFEQSPKPSSVMIGRWASAATAGELLGGILNVAAQNITNFNNITNGGIDFVVDGVTRNLTAIDLSSTSNLNGVASAITTAFAGHATATWNGSQFIVTSTTNGGGNPATGQITFSAIPTAGTDTLTVDGTAIAFVSGAPSGNQIQVGSSALQTVANTLLFLQTSADVNISKMTYTRSGLVITATSIIPGTTGNAYTLAKSSTAITVSGATLTGGQIQSSVSFATAGAGQDLSTLLALTSTTAQYTVNGIAAESALQAVQLLDTLPVNWYGLQGASASLQNSDKLAIAQYIEGATRNHLYGITTSDTAALSSTDTTSIGYQLKQLGYNRSFAQYSSTTPHASASMFGLAATVNFNGSNTTITLMYKQEPGVVPEQLTTSQANALDANNYNYFAGFDNGTSILVNGKMASGLFFDSQHNADWLANNVQTNVYNLLYQTPTKVPQTDSGEGLIGNQIEASCKQGVTNGYIAPGVWNSAGFGQLVQGTFLSKGYYVYAPTVASQEQADREARKSVPFQVAIKEAGAVHDVQINISVNR